MRVTTTNSADPGDEVLLVGRTFRGPATWCGDARVEAGAVVDVELDVDDVVDWADIAIFDTPPDLPTVTAEGVLVAGPVVALEEDDILTVSVDDSLVMIETTGAAPIRFEGRHVLLRARDLRAHPFLL
ncbi:hypothetical protein [Cellulomonas xiejunii]|uniref:hypothetical protein n=1 Tax=Cellulomonas xiejunii TaxID=2968083 RepID=UPI001D0E2F2D|nr:hypothetical protein [Cellulomonas xiejunii]MCC2313684.1 hypothetical protein [Cellulomonas xiejunii]